jgi:hypothetical protein
VTGSGTTVNDLQTLTISGGTPTSGNISIQFVDQNGITQTVSVAFNQTATALQPSFDALTPSASDIVVAGGPFPGTPLTFSFQNDFAGRFQTLMINAGTTLNNSAVATFTHTTAGCPATGYYKAYNSGNSDGSQTARKLLRQPALVTPDGAHHWGGSPGSFVKDNQQFMADGYFQGDFYVNDLTGLDSTAIGQLGHLINANTITDPGLGGTAGAGVILHMF